MAEDLGTSTNEKQLGEKVGRHTTYKMQIKVGNITYDISKRYTEFRMLHQHNQQNNYPEIDEFDFPRKVFFHRFSPSLVAYRKQKFEEYLDLLFRIFLIKIRNDKMPTSKNEQKL